MQGGVLVEMPNENVNVLQTLIQFRRGTEEQWNLVKDSYIPRAGEPCTTIDGANAGQIKVGDGTHTWGELKYVGVGDLKVIKIYGDTTADTSVSVGDKTYATIEEAIADAPAGTEVKLSGSLSDNTVNIDKELTLDMNGVRAVNNEESLITVGINGKLTLKNGELECNKNGVPNIEVNGETTLSDCTVVRTIEEKNNCFYAVLNHGKMIINSGLFSAIGTDSSLVENGYYNYTSTNPIQGYVEGKNQPYPELIVNGGTFVHDSDKSKLWLVKNDDGGKLTINDGVFYGRVINQGIEMVINGGHFVSDSKMVIGVRKINDNLNLGKTIINGGVFEGNIEKVFEDYGAIAPDVQVKGGKFKVAVEEKYIASGYEQKLVNGWYVVSKKGE